MKSCLGRSLFSSFLCNGSLVFSLGSFILGSRSVLAGLACTLGSVLHCSGLGLLFGSLLVGLFYLALLKSFRDGCTASVENHLDAVLCIIVCRDDEVYVAGI